MRTLILFFALTVTCRGGEQLPFYGKPRAMFRELWAGAQESSVNTPPFAKRCRAFAARHTPEIAIPEMLRDFAQYPGETKGMIYSYIMSQWPRRTVVRILKPYANSPDPKISYMAGNFYADFEY